MYHRPFSLFLHVTFLCLAEWRSRLPTCPGLTQHRGSRPAHNTGAPDLPTTQGLQTFPHTGAPDLPTTQGLHADMPTTQGLQTCPQHCPQHRGSRPAHNTGAPDLPTHRGSRPAHNTGAPCRHAHNTGAPDLPTTLPTTQGLQTCPQCMQGLQCAIFCHLLILCEIMILNHSRLQLKFMLLLTSLKLIRYSYDLTKVSAATSRNVSTAQIAVRN